MRSPEPQQIPEIEADTESVRACVRILNDLDVDVLRLSMRHPEIIYSLGGA
jgi:hypothetical protein